MTTLRLVFPFAAVLALASLACSSGSSDSDVAATDTLADNRSDGADTVSPSDQVELADVVTPPDLKDATELSDAADLSDLPQPTDLTELTDVVDTADSGDVPTPEWPSQATMVGSISIEENPGEYASSVIDVSLWSLPVFGAYEMVLAQDACVYLKPMGLGQCEPACDTYGSYCDPKTNTCKTNPGRMDAGTITFHGLNGGGDGATATPDESAWYTLSPETLPANLFDPSSQITVSAQGGADVSPFEAHLQGVGDMEVTSFEYNLVLLNDTPNIVSWEVQNDMAQVELLIQVGWHGAPPTAIIYCIAEDAAGQIELPQEMVKEFPAIGGIGLFQHPCNIARVNREVITTPTGPVEVVVASQYGFSVEH